MPAMPVVFLAVLGLGALPEDRPPVPDGEYLIESSLKKGMLLGLKGNKAQDREVVTLLGPTADHQPNHRWRIIHVGKGEYVIETALKEEYLLEARGGKTDDFTLVELGRGREEKKRRWRLIPVGDNEYMIETALKAKVFLDVQGASTENDTTIQLAGTGDGGRDQVNRRWRLIPVRR
jgi:hypothetical protein